MNLVIDQGNSSAKMALFSTSGQLIHAMTIPQLTVKNIVDFAEEKFTSSIICSVTEYEAAVLKYLEVQGKCIQFNVQIPIPVKLKYQTPNTLGLDRLAAAIGAISEFPGKNILVIDAGTAITYDFISDEKEYLGGGISPGIQMRFKALNQFTHRLPLIDWMEKSKSILEIPLIGDNTENSLLSGVLNGVQAEMEGIIDRYARLYGDLTIVMTGGDLNFLVDRIKYTIFAQPNAVLQGLHLILKYNEELA